MSGPTRHDLERLMDLLAARATEGLAPDETRELEALLLAHPDVDPRTLDLAAAAIDASRTLDEPIPDTLRAKLDADARAWDERGVTVARLSAPPTPFVRWAGWIAAAASLTLACVAWWTRPAPGLSIATARDLDTFLRETPDAVRAPWGDFNALESGEPPEIRGVSGEVIWSASRQAGFMRFRGLPANPTDPATGTPADEYQLWIVDAQRGLQQRISGGIFSVRSGSGEVIVPITTSLRVNKAAVFAVTIEQPGGVWVSDMSRRVCLAAVGG